MTTGYILLGLAVSIGVYLFSLFMFIALPIIIIKSLKDKSREES
jgi:hypothetical protein